MIRTSAVTQHSNSGEQSSGVTFAVVIPTCNATSSWKQLYAGLKRQGVKPDQVLVIDSSSTDNTQDLVRQAGYRLKVIERSSFRHGATRQVAAEMLSSNTDILIYLTQDAIPDGNDSIRNLIAAFDDPTIGAAYGRQIPREQADEIESHARLFNYAATSAVRDFESRKEFGVKTAFFSNSFAAYRRTAFDEVGGFPKFSIVSEEVTVVARMLMAGWRIAYRADAPVIHSHHFTVMQEFARYFDIGVHHGREAWLLETFGRAGGEGARFVRSEAAFLRKTRPTLLPLAAIRTVSKFCAYQLGRHESILPTFVKRMLSSQPTYWHDEKEQTRLQSIVATRPWGA